MIHFKSIPVLLLLLVFSVVQSQVQYNAAPGSNNSILIEGTSNIHDWEILAKNFTSQIDLTASEGELEKVNSIDLSIPVKSFNSGKGKMDKNTYKALNEDEYKLVSFTSSIPVQLVETSTGVYKAMVQGELTISGTTKTVEIPVEFHKTNAGFILKADQGLNMTDYGIEPPTALFGTITTGETVNIIFNLTHYKS
ncbi:YceI family protein [Psychroflexus sp. CAK8W]|uniref:YceI family protein n=1 Tax=Psychroflexus longus TaxID=2873596 RepID=A0ABS7XG55_9FLAO|nr:YceI family protein [Psychroflexus longus]MBZ9777685.1 YceI family protein [Psychroflexus longus]